jgi:hypothetical protein
MLPPFCVAEWMRTAAQVSTAISILREKFKNQNRQNQKAAERRF